MHRKLSLQEVNHMDHEEFVAKFCSLYEHSPWVAEAASTERPFDDIEKMHRAFERAMYRAPREKQLDLIRAHPDLAGKAAMVGALTPESKREQSSAALDRLSPEEYDAFTGANRAYREKFGFPLVVYAREHNKDTILENAAARLENSREEEIATALKEISRIARYRLGEIFEKGDER